MRSGRSSRAETKISLGLYTFDRESDDERALSHEVLVAELAYNSHSRKKELDLIRSMIV